MKFVNILCNSYHAFGRFFFRHSVEKVVFEQYHTCTGVARRLSADAAYTLGHFCSSISPQHDYLRLDTGKYGLGAQLYTVKPKQPPRLTVLALGQLANIDYCLIVTRCDYFFHYITVAIRQS